MTKYQPILIVNGNRTVLNFKSERKTVGALVKAIMACSDVVKSVVSVADLESDSYSKGGKFFLGSSYVFWEAC